MSKAIPNLTENTYRNRGLEEQVVFWAYREAAGDSLCRKVKPVMFVNGKLVLECDSPRWMQVMNNGYDRIRIIETVNEHLGRNVLKSIEIK